MTATEICSSKWCVSLELSGFGALMVPVSGMSLIKNYTLQIRQNATFPGLVRLKRERVSNPLEILRIKGQDAFNSASTSRFF